MRSATALNLKYLERLSNWALSKNIKPIKILTQKDANRMNRNEKIWKKLYNMPVNKWKKGDEYYALLKEV